MGHVAISHATSHVPRCDRGWRRLLPQSLFSRVTLIIVLGLAIAQALAFISIRHERGIALRELMMAGIERDIASSIAILDRLNADERASWLGKLARRNYRFTLDGDVQGPPPHTASASEFAKAFVEALRPYAALKVAQVAEGHDGLQILVRLADGSPIVVHARRVEMPVSAWVIWILLAQLMVLAACAWVMVRLVTRPLARLAAAADGLGLDLKARALDEAGPSEVAHAARAFNEMQRRIARYTAERVEILASISHDLQTPITRMRLRLDLMDHEQDRAKFRQDLDAMQALVREGVAYARTLHGSSEPPTRVDVDALLEAMVADYEDAGHTLRLEGRVGEAIVTRPHALRRILTNLVDNALKFGSDALVQVTRSADRLVIAVIDNGPGIPPDQLDAVLQPFYRVESSRNRSTGGTGLGLAIAHQLSMALGAALELRNRSEGGLEARLKMSATSAPPP
ncbi:ATP-binding protein [Piscinibacter sp. XHJ-5]|uniref:sensor histidine kinase n=1 Tax=Piscinibacter sp. XHJ-5 TaxID=3037797 RepID=UPI002453592B|nr:ATP-binding protein [Piscinibacter sp. XHJ-5]